MDDPLTIDEDNSVVLDLLANDSDVDGDAISIDSINGTDLTPGTAQTIAVTNRTVLMTTSVVMTFPPIAI